MASRARADGALRLACALCAALLAHSERARAADGQGPSLSGRVSLDYVPRWLQGTDYRDQDIYATVLADWRGNDDRFSGSFFWRSVKDIDGLDPPKDSPFRSVYDAYGGEWFHQLFYAYIDMRTDGPVRLARAGRQFLYEGQPFHFDGVRFDSRKGLGGLGASLFGGVPVHYFESSREGDWLVGFGVEARPWPGGRVSALYAHVEDDARFFGLPVTSEVDDLLVLSANAFLGEWGSALARYTAVDAQTRDLFLRAQTYSERTDTCVFLSYYRQPRTLAEFSIDLSVYDLIQGESYPYDKFDLAVSKGFRTSDGARVGLEAGGTVRRLSDATDEGEYNRDYGVVRLGMGFESAGPRKLTTGIGQVWWWSSGDDASAFEAEVSYEPNEDLKLSMGTTYALFKYDILGFSERADVREAYLKVRWKATEKAELRFRYAAEREADEGLIHTLGLRWAMRF